MRRNRPSSSGSFRSPHHEAVAEVLRTADQLRRYFAATIDPFGITLQQYNVLRILRDAEPEGLPTLAIVERMIERTPGITRLLDRLERKGLVKRQRSRQDRREVLCRVTASGLALLSRLDDPVGAADEAVMAPLDRKDRRKLVELLEAVHRALPRHSQFSSP